MRIATFRVCSLTLVFMGLAIAIGHLGDNIAVATAPPPTTPDSTAPPVGWWKYWQSFFSFFPWNPSSSNSGKGGHSAEDRSASNRTRVPDQHIVRYADLLALAAIPYCQDEIFSKRWQCPACLDWVDRLDLPHVYPLGASWRTFGFVAPSKPSHNTVYISFRGSVTFSDWLADIEFAQNDFSMPFYPEKVKVHYGFWSSFSFMAKDLDSALDSIFKKSPAAINDSSFIILGHSLGGAVAQICALHLMVQYGISSGKISIITLNSPRVGNHDFARLISQELAFHEFVRIVNQHDWVPHLPPRASGFFHGGTELWISEEGDFGKSFYCPRPGASYTPADMDLTSSPFVDTESLECANKLNYFYEWEAQHSYAWSRRVGVESCNTPASRLLFSEPPVMSRRDRTLPVSPIPL